MVAGADLRFIESQPWRDNRPSKALPCNNATGYDRLIVPGCPSRPRYSVGTASPFDSRLALAHQPAHSPQLWIALIDRSNGSSLPGHAVVSLSRPPLRRNAVPVVLSATLHSVANNLIVIYSHCLVNNYLPVLPNPSEPRTVLSRLVTISSSGVVIFSRMSWAIRSPRDTSYIPNRHDISTLSSPR